MRIAKIFKDPGKPDKGVDWAVETPKDGWQVDGKTISLSSSPNQVTVYADEAAAAVDGYKAPKKSEPTPPELPKK